MAVGWYPGVDVQGVAGTWGLGLLVGMWAWGPMVPRGRSGQALVASSGVAVRVCVGEPSDGVCLWCPPSVRLAGCDAGGAPGWLVLGLLAGACLWTRRVVFGVVDPGRWQGSDLGTFAGLWCRGVARVGRLRSPYSCGWAWFPSRQVMSGALGSLWLRGAATGVVAPPVWMHILAGGFVACRPQVAPQPP